MAIAGSEEELDVAWRAWRAEGGISALGQRDHGNATRREDQSGDCWAGMKTAVKRVAAIVAFLFGRGRARPLLA